MPLEFSAGSGRLSAPESFALAVAFYPVSHSMDYVMSVKFKSIVALVCVFTLLAGCSEEEGAGAGEGIEVSCFNPAETVDLVRSTWTVSEDLEYTQADDVLKSMQPSPVANDASDTAQLLKNYLQTQTMAAVGIEGEAQAATTYTNALDLIEEIIADNEVANFTVGRAMVAGCASVDVPTRYNNKSVTVRHTDGRAPMSYLVDYNYSGSPEAGDIEYVTRTLWEFSRSVENTEENPEEATTLAASSSLSVTTYQKDLFTTTGYMKPSSVIASWSGSSGSSVSIYKDYDQVFKDTAEYVNPDGFTLSDSLGKLKRLKIRVNYQTGTAEVFVSDFIVALAVVNMNDEITDIILKDITDDELKVLFEKNPDWKLVGTYKDPGYDGESATPLTTYTGTLLPHRG
jgi:hypothetical protein